MAPARPFRIPAADRDAKLASPAPFNAAPGEQFWFLKNCQLLSRLPHQELALLEQRSRSKRFKSGEVIYIPVDRAEAVLVLVSGQVKLCHMTPDGKESILAFIEAGEMFGELCLVGAESREELAIAMQPSTIVLIPQREMEQLMQRQAQLSLGLSRLLGFRRLRIERRLKSLLFRSSRDRLLQLLGELASDHGDQTSEGVEIRLRLSHQDFASLIGSTRETVTNTLGQLQVEGVVRLGRQRVTICSLPRLTAMLETLSE